MSRTLLPVVAQLDLAALLDHVADLVYVVDGQGFITAVNPAATFILGLAPEHLIGRRESALVHPDDRKSLRLGRQRDGDAARQGPFRYRMRHRSGSWRLLEGRVVDASDDPRVCGQVVTARDVTERSRADDAARRQLDRLQAALDAAPFILFTCDPDGICTLAEGGGLRGVPIEPRAVVGLNLVAAYVENSRRTAQLDDDALGGLWDPEDVVSGSIDFGGHIVGFSRAPIHDGAGELVGVAGVAFDGIEQIRTVDGGADFDERFVRVFNKAPMGMGILDASGRWLQVNQTLCNMLGRRSAELLDKPADRHVHPDDRQKARDVLGRLVAGRTPGEQREVRMCRADGRVVHALISVTGLHDHAGGGASHMLLQIVDVTERREMEEAARRSEAWLRRVVDSVPIAVFAFDGQGVVTMAAGRLSTYLGLPAEEINGRQVSAACLGRRDVVENVQLALAGREVTAVVDHDSSVFDVWYGPIFDENGAVTSGVGVAHDVTRLHRVDDDRQRLLSSSVRAEEADRARLAWEVHDEALQHMTAIGIRIEHVRQRLTDASDIERIDHVTAALDHAVRCLRTLLARIQPPRFDRCGLAGALEEHARAVLGGADIDVVVENELRVPPDHDCSTVVYRIAQGALANVRSHAGARRVTIRLQSVGSGILTTVDDDGTGFTPNQDGTDRRPARRRAEIAGGWHRIFSAPGLGTSVHFWVPARCAADDARGEGPVSCVTGADHEQT